jgi:predicted phosphodiesterase
MATKYKKFIAVSCSHGDLLSRSARASVLKFIDAYRPDTRIHLGDYIDLTALRGGARGKDETINLENDVAAGLEFLGDYRPTHLLQGNHDVRAWEALSHPSAVLAHAAADIVKRVRAFTKKTKCQFIEEYNIRDANFITLGDTKFMHGIFFSETAVRDHAEHFGKCVFGHLHKVEVRPGRRFDNPMGYCVGMLADIKMMKYADRRRATSQWSNGFAWGEYNDRECIVYLSTPSKDGWKLPL